MSLRLIGAWKRVITNPDGPNQGALTLFSFNPHPRVCFTGGREREKSTDV